MCLMALSWAEPALAGSASYIGAAAVTADSKYYAAFQEWMVRSKCAV